MTDEKQPRQRGVTRTEFNEVKLALKDYEKLLDEARADAKLAATSAKETHDKVSDVHKALMMPFPGQDKSLLDRMALVTINVESGGRVASMTVKLAAILAAIGATWAIISGLIGPK
ncbi:MAG: hypothetical protein II336_18165 [Loktanella sp.]|nr:hypothetical protein [Loktanella sp.]